MSVNKKYLKLNAVTETKVLPATQMANFEGAISDKDTLGNFMIAQGQMN